MQQRKKDTVPLANNFHHFPSPSCTKKTNKVLQNSAAKYD